MNRLKKLFKLPWFILLVIFIEGILLSSTAVDKAGIPLLKWMGPGRPGTYEDYLAGQANKPVQVKELQVLRPALNRYMNLTTETKKVLVLVSPRVFSGLHEKILRYGIDLNLHHRLQKPRPGLVNDLLQGPHSADTKGHFTGIDVVVRAVNENKFQIDHGITGQKAFSR